MSIEKQPQIIEKNTKRNEILNTVEEIHQDALLGESFEDASLALESVEDLQGFRKKLKNIPFASFHSAIEEMTNINKRGFGEEERDNRINHLTRAMEEKAVRMSPRVADLYMGLIAEIREEQYAPKYEMTAKKIAELKDQGDLDVLLSGDTSWEMKINRIETRLVGYLSGAKAFDRREDKELNDDVREWREEELKKAPNTPPERRNESKPGVDAMDRLKEGERAPAIWSIYPAYGGYYKEQSFSEWDSGRNAWKENEYNYSDVEKVPLLEEENPKKGLINLTMTAHAVAGRWVSLPVPYTHALHGVEAGGRSYSAQEDQNGDLVILVDGNGEDVEIKVILAPIKNKRFTTKTENVKTPNMPAEFTDETVEKIAEIKANKRGNINRAQALASYVRSRIKYLAPKDQTEGDYYNNYYNTHAGGFAGAVDEIKQADCDVANTYFAALCAKLNIPVRHCVGHSVKGKDELGASGINSGTGHGWSEVWNEIKKEWTRIDATPPGDSQLQDEEEKGKSEAIPGDFGEQEAIRPSDEEIENLRKKLLEHKEKLSYTREERQLAEHAGVELKEAREIVKEINEAENTRLPNGERIVDSLSRLFNAIVESRKVSASIYDGPVRKREGGEGISDIVRHKIGVLAGDSDPMSREKPSTETRVEKKIGGFDLYMIGDKSGSMASTVEGEALWKMQRRAEYLIFSSLHRFEKNLERAGLQKENSLSVRTQGVSFRGSEDGDIDLDKPLSTEFRARDKVKMWHSLSDAGGGNGDPEALSLVYEQIKSEVKETDKSGAKDNRLRLIIACSDGGYIGNDGAKMQMLSEKLYKELNVIVVGMGLTDTAKSVKVVMDNPPYSRGDVASDINDLPAIVAKHLISEAIKLFPEKAKESAKQLIDNSLKKFNNI